MLKRIKRHVINLHDDIVSPPSVTYVRKTRTLSETFRYFCDECASKISDKKAERNEKRGR